MLSDWSTDLPGNNFIARFSSTNARIRGAVKNINLPNRKMCGKRDALRKETRMLMQRAEKMIQEKEVEKSFDEDVEIL